MRVDLRGASCGHLACELLVILVGIRLNVLARPLLELAQEEGGHAAAVDERVAQRVGDTKAVEHGVVGQDCPRERARTLDQSGHR